MACVGQYRACTGEGTRWCRRIWIDEARSARGYGSISAHMVTRGGGSGACPTLVGAAGCDAGRRCV